MTLSDHDGGGSHREPPPPISPPSSSAINSSDKNTDSTSPSPPPATTYPTHAPPGAGYPPPYGSYYPPAGYPAGYPAGQNPHAYPQGYAAYTNGYPTGYQNHPPAAAYYGPPPTYATAGAVNPGSRFLRSFILCGCIILTFIFLGSILMALMLRPEVPVYKLVAMSVTNFTTNPTLFGEWDTKMTIQNPNEKLKAYFSNFKVDIIYKDGVLSVNYAPGFALNTKEARDMDITGSSTKANESTLDKTTKDEMEKERANGSITITLRVASLNAFESGSFTTRTSQIVAICDGLKLVFPNNSTTGTLDNGGKPMLCNLYI
ncbi:hypothetical protein Lal_00039672 [Lupinus albus]|uniref:Uncharacterized protein n=1 Tax=Lupinus albus TaxID=3870 RepID=A0A6A4QEM9_LUPAL|nr:hypothetical protein Lalb_Chr06g0172611 [Lupinus albus]KAF1879801.1 hypothetical protein Lal_00039672 [Lupinus albus]